MFQQFKNWLKNILGNSALRLIRPIYHGFRAYAAAFRYGFAAGKLKIIGITGTKGKTTTTVFTGRLFNLSDIKTGYISSAVINLGNFKKSEFKSGFTSTGEVLNKHKMGSLDPFILQKYLAKMVENNCEYAILEMTSQGLESNRHLGLFGFNISVFLNIFPEHLDAHGSFDNYKKAKLKLFQKMKPKSKAILNANSLESAYFEKNINSNRTEIVYVLDQNKNSLIQNLSPKKVYNYSISQDQNYCKSLKFGSNKFQTDFLADFNIFNLAFAVTILKEAEPLINVNELNLEEIKGVPGRMEWVVKDNKIIYQSNLPNLKTEAVSNFSIMVDYAHEPESLKQLLTSLNNLKVNKIYNKIVHIFSVTGSGRDIWKRSVMAKISAENADIVIITSEDHDKNDNIFEMMKELESYFEDYKNKTQVLVQPNRAKAFETALLLSAKNFEHQNVLVVSTAMGAQQGMETASGIENWDEREVWLKVWLKFLNLT